MNKNESERFNEFKPSSMWPALPIILFICYYESKWSMLFVFIPVFAYFIWLYSKLYLEIDSEKVTGPASGPSLLIGKRKTIFLKDIDINKSFITDDLIRGCRIISKSGVKIPLCVGEWISKEEVAKIKKRVIQLRV